MGVKRRQSYGETEWCWLIFWIERIGFLILALSWVFVERKPGRGFLSFDTFWKCIACLNYFWMCTTLLYLAIFAGEISNELQGKTEPQGEEKPKPFSLVTGFWGFGLLMERAAVLIWEDGIRRLGVEYGPKYGILSSLFIIIIPMWNIYLALVKNSADLLRGDHHDQQKELVDDSRTEKEEPDKQEDLKHVFLRADRILFWVERAGFSIMALTWVLLLTTEDWLLSWKSCLQYTIIIDNFWICTNSLYFVVYILRLLFVEKDKEPRGKEKEQKPIMAEGIGHWFFKKVGNHPGFWSERLALFVFACWVNLFASLYPRAIAVLDYYFVVIFPSLNLYFAWFGYSNEFGCDSLNEGLPDGGGGRAKKEEIQPQNTTAPADFTAKKGAYGDSEVPKIVEDWTMVRLLSELETALNKNLERDLEKMQDAWKAMEKKIVEKCEEDYQKLKEQINELASKLSTTTPASAPASASLEKLEDDYQRMKERNDELAMKLCAADTSSELYRSLLHDNIFVIS